MKKNLTQFALIALSICIIISMSACLDPVSMIPDMTFNISGDINFTDVTAGAFVIHNLSKTITVHQIDVRHPVYTLGNWYNATTNSNGDIVRRFGLGGIGPVPPAGPGVQKAIFADASEDNYVFEISWEVYVNDVNGVPVRHSGQIDATFPMPASRMVREFFLFKSEVTDPNDPFDFEDADEKRWLVLVTDWVHGVRVADPSDTYVNIDNIYIGDLNLDLDGMIRNIINVEPVIQNVFDKSLFDGLNFYLDFGFTPDQFFEAISNAQINVRVEPEINSVLTMDPEFRAYLEESKQIFMEMTSGISLIADAVSFIARGIQNGPLILLNESNQIVWLEDIIIVPVRNTIDSLLNNRYTIERDALFARLDEWRTSGQYLAAWPGGNATISTSSRQLPEGDYVVTYGGVSIPINIQPGLYSNYANQRDTNTFVITTEMLTNPPGCDCGPGGNNCKCGNNCTCKDCVCPGGPGCNCQPDPLIPGVSSISFSVPLSGYSRIATAAETAAAPNGIVSHTLPNRTTSVALPVVLFNGNLSAAERQAVVSHSAALWESTESGPPIPGTQYGVNPDGSTNYNLLVGSGVDASSSYFGFRPYYRKVNNTNAFIIYRIHPDANKDANGNGHAIRLQINFP